MSFVKDTFDSLTGRGAEKASKSAANTSAAAQREALEYLKETEALPQQYREGALSMLGGLYGIPDFSGTASGGSAAREQSVPWTGGSGLIGNVMRNLQGQTDDGGNGRTQTPYMGAGQAMSALRNSPVYQATLGMLPEQEDAILRNQSATGALRSGGTDLMLAENQRNNQLSALQNTMGGLQGLAGLQSYAPQIAQGMAGIGDTLAQGQIAGANARQQGMGNMLGMGMNAAMLAGFSDIRLKDNIRPAGERYGHDWYTWEWNEEAAELGLSGEAEGVLAQDVAKTHPEAVGLERGYLTVNYESLGLA